MAVDRSLGFYVLVDADTRKATAKVGDFASNMRKRITAAVKALPDIKIDADSSAAHRRLAAIRGELAELSGKRIGVDIDAAAAQAQIQRLQGELRRLAASSRSVQVRADTAAALTALGEVDRRAARLDGRNVTMTARVDGQRALSMLGLIAAGLSTVGSLAPAAAGALAAIPAAAGAGAQGLGTLAAGFTGLGDAVSALSDVESEAAKTSTAAGESRAAAAERVASAQRALGQAQVQADRAAVTGAQQVADAERALGDAHRNRQASQEALTRAVRDAREANEDLQLSLRGAALSEEEAVDRLDDARARLAEARATGAGTEEIDDLDRAVRQAALGLDEARERYGDLRTEQDEWARSGVAGSERVRDAQRGVAEADRGVADAQEALTRAQQQAAWAQADAAAQVVDAQRQLAEAMVTTGAAAAGSTAAADKLAEAMAKLSPEGQRFARFLHGEMLPALREVRNRIQESMLPQLEQSLRNMLPVLPVFADGLAETGRSIGDLTLRGSEMMSSGPWRADFATIMAGNNRVIRDLGEAGLFAADSWRHLTVTGLPLVERLSQAAERGAALAAAWLATKRSTGELDAFMAAAGDTLFELGETLVQVATAVGQVTLALGPLGGILLNTVGTVAELIGNFAAANPLLTQFAAAAILASTVAVKLGTTIAGAAAAMGVAGGGFAILGQRMAGLMPAALSVSLAGRFATVAESAGALTGRLSGSADAADRVTAAGSRVGTVMARIGSALPAAAVALGVVATTYNHLTVSASEAANAINEGGLEAERARHSIGVMEAGTRGFHAVLGPLITTQREATDAARAQYDQLGPLARAQSDVQRAMNDYQLVLRDHSPHSEEARAAAGRLAEAQRVLEGHQTRAADATKTHTDRITEQRDTMLGAANADIAYQQSILAVESAQRSMTEALTQYGAGSHQAKEATLRYQESLYSSVTAAGEAARSQYAHRDSAEASRAALEAENARILELIVIAGANAPPALLAMAGAMDSSMLSALGARIKVDEFGHSVLVLPNGKEVPISAPGVQHSIDKVNEFRTAIANLPPSGWLRHYSIGITGDAGPGAARPMTGGLAGVLNQASGGVLSPVGMAAGGVRSMRRDVARAVDPRQPVMMGDRMRGREYFLPDDSSPRTMAIGTEWAAARGLRLVPMADGGVLGPPVGGTAGRMWQGGGAPSVPMDPAVVTELAEAVRGLTAGALEPMVAELTGSTVPALLTTLEHYGLLAAGVDTATVGMTGSTTTMQTVVTAAWADMTAQTGLRVAETRDVHLLALASAQRAAEASQLLMRDTSNNAWLSMASTTAAQVGSITGPVFGGLHAGMASVEQHGVTMADGWSIQLARLRAAAADPIRWVMQFPLGPPGIAASWNTLDDQFKLGKRINPPAPAFAQGGFHEDHSPQITRPGGSMRVWSEPETGGEAYIPLASAKRRRSTGILAEVADRFGLGVVPKGDVALFADGGLWRSMFGIVQRQFPNARLTSAYRAGDPGYHGSGRATDIAGPMGAVNQWLANNFANSTQLIYTPGVNLFRGRPHTYNAATRADHHDHVHWAMENAAMLRGAPGNYTGGTGGGEAFDPRPAVDAAFKRTYELLGDVTRLHGDSAHVTGVQAVARQAVDAVRAKALEQLAATMGGGALGAVGAGAPFHIREISKVAQARGLGPEGATIGVATGLVESNLRNLASTRYPESRTQPGVEGIGSDHDSVGVFQQRPSQGWGTVAQCMNTAHAAGSFFSRLPGDWRSRDPGMVAADVQRPAARYRGRYGTRMGQARGLVGQHGGFDGGGYARGLGLLDKRVIPPERVLSPRQTVAFERLVDEVLDTRRGSQPVIVAAPLAASTGAGSGGPVIGSMYVTTPTGATPQQMLQEAFFHATHHRKGLHG